MLYVSKNLQKLKEVFKCKIARIGLSFDEDIFSDTLIKCNEKLSQKGFNDKQMFSYFWTAFRTNTLRDLNYMRNKTTDKIPDNIIEDENVTNEIFENVSKMIIEKFGEELYQLFVLHSNGMPYEELENITSRKKLKYSFRRIREYIRKNYTF